MNIPYNLKEQIGRDHFAYDKGIVVYISNTVFDAVEHVPEYIDGQPNDDNKPAQFMGDLPACVDDIEAFQKAMEYFDLTDTENIYVLHNE